MKTFGTDVAAAYAAGRVSKRSAIRFDLPSGSYGFITGYKGSLTHEGTLYVGSGGLLTMDAATQAIADEADERVIELASSQIINGTLVQVFDPHLLDSIEDEIWYLQPAVLQRFYFDTSRRLIDVEQVDIRRIWDVQHLRGESNGRRIRAILRTPAALAKVVEAKRNGPDLQSQVDPSDTGYNDILTALSDPIYWGRATPTPGSNPSR